MSERKPLAISCKATRCGPDVPAAEKRHAFISPVGALPGVAGACHGCGRADLVDWQLCHERDLALQAAFIGELRQELIRDNYWGLPLPEHVLRKARKRSSGQLKVSIGKALSEALIVDNFREGWQTSFAYRDEATIVQCAQHGTATCCRECLEKWYGIPRRVELSRRDRTFLEQICWAYVDRRLDDGLVLPEEAA